MSYTYEQLRAGGWSDAQILSVPEYANLVPRQAAPPPPPPQQSFPPPPQQQSVDPAVMAAMQGYGAPQQQQQHAPMHHPQTMGIGQSVGAPVSAPVLNKMNQQTQTGVSMKSMADDAHDVDYSSSEFEFKACVLGSNSSKTLRLFGQYRRCETFWVHSDGGDLLPIRVPVGGKEYVPYMAGQELDSKRVNIIKDLLEPILHAKAAVDYEDAPLINGQAQMDNKGKKKQVKVYKYQQYDPNLFAELLGAGAASDNKWFQKSSFLFNCIDREALWCGQHKHTMILSKSDKSPGIGPELFTAIYKQSEIHGPYDSYDMVLSRSGNGMSTSYTASIAPGNSHVLLTDDELNYSEYDLSVFAEPAKKDYIYQHFAKKLLHIIAFVKRIGLGSAIHDKVESEILAGPYLKQAASGMQAPGASNHAPAQQTGAFAQQPAQQFAPPAMQQQQQMAPPVQYQQQPPVANYAQQQTYNQAPGMAQPQYAQQPPAPPVIPPVANYAQQQVAPPAPPQIPAQRMPDTSFNPAEFETPAQPQGNFQLPPNVTPPAMQQQSGSPFSPHPIDISKDPSDYIKCPSCSSMNDSSAATCATCGGPLVTF